jgi:hypothetical protein
VGLGKLTFKRKPARFGWLAKLISKSERKESKWRTFKVLLVGAFTPALILSILFQLCAAPSEFFAAGPGIDIFGHTIGFLLGFAGAAAGFLAGFQHFRG